MTLEGEGSRSQAAREGDRFAVRRNPWAKAATARKPGIASGPALRAFSDLQNSALFQIEAAQLNFPSGWVGNAGDIHRKEEIATVSTHGGIVGSGQVGVLRELNA